MRLSSGRYWGGLAGLLFWPLATAIWCLSISQRIPGGLILLGCLIVAAFWVVWHRQQTDLRPTIAVGFANAIGMLGIVRYLLPSEMADAYFQPVSFTSAVGGLLLWLTVAMISLTVASAKQPTAISTPSAQ